MPSTKKQSTVTVAESGHTGIPHIRSCVDDAGTCVQKWLEMAVIDLLESKRTEAAALENVDILLEEKEILKEKLSIQQELCRLEKEKLQDALTRVNTSCLLCH